MKINIKEIIKKDFPLAPLTTFKIGGKTKFFAEIKTKEELEAIVEWAHQQKEKIYILGGGSNVLINDAGVNGLVIKIINQGIIVKGTKIIVAAGEMLGTIVGVAMQNNLSGLEWAAGIPGTIGGAVRGNAGAYGDETGNSIQQVEAFDLEQLKFIKFNKANCDFAYRQSIFKTNPNFIVWQAEFLLQPGTAEEINNKTINHIQNRACGQPKLPSAGCAFKNLFADDLKKINPKLYQEAVEKKLIKGKKIGCGYFIDQLNLKGKKIGQAMVSLEHANFIVNSGQATATDVKKLINYVQAQMKANYNIELKEEVQYFGFE